MGKRDFDFDIEFFRFFLFLVLLMTRHCCWAWLFCLFCLRCRWGTLNPHCYGFHNGTIVSFLSLIKLVFSPTRAFIYWWFRSYTWQVFFSSLLLLMLRMAALRRYALSKLFNLELAESIIVCDNGVLLVHAISISGFIIFQDFFFFMLCNLTSNVGLIIVSIKC